MKTFTFLIVFFLMFSNSKATHFMGGEITWECMPNGNYRFIMKLYRECYTTNGNSALTFAETETLNTTVPGLPNITMTRISLADMSPVCNLGLASRVFCPGMVNGNANMGALQENVYTSDAAFPDGVALVGTPPPAGWIFFIQSCCRNPSTNVPNSNSLTWRLRAIMYPYTPPGSTVPLPANPCHDSSPFFAERPSTVICSGYPFTFNHNAFDPDLDSITFSWASPNLTGGANITSYAAGYSFNSPLPSAVHNPNNIPAIINPVTGETSIKSYNQGTFITCVRAASYRNGILIAENFRDLQVVLLSCQPNNMPSFSLFPNNDTIVVPIGTNLNFPISASDFGTLAGLNIPKTITLNAISNQFGNNFSDVNAGCAEPPCAILNTPMPISGIFNVTTNFNWQTSCEHAHNPVNNLPNRLYEFVFKVSDDFCPAPFFKYQRFHVKVYDNTIVNSPNVTCLESFPNGNIKLEWEIPTDAYSTFNSYLIYYKSSTSNEFVLIDSIFNINTNMYIHNTSQGNLGKGTYKVKTRSGCSGKSIIDDYQEVNNMFLQATYNQSNNSVLLKWNHILSNASSVNSPYYIFKENAAGIVTLIDSTYNTQYIDNNISSYLNIYYITTQNLNNCVSYSNTVTVTLTNIYEQEKELNIFPNPFDREINVCVENLTQHSMIELYNLKGKKVLEQKFNSIPCTIIDTRMLDAGVYFLKLINESITYSKVIKID